MHQSISKLFIVLTALLCTLSASAQDDARQILEQSAQAIKDSEGFSAKVTLSGEGSQMILATLPSLNARFTTGTHPTLGKVIHLIGEFRPQSASPPESFDVVYTNDKLLWTDHTTQTINIRPPSVSARQKPAPLKYMMLAELLSDAPYQSELNTAEDITLDPSQTIGDTLCKVVTITRAKATGARTSGLGSHTSERWYIGADDRLPRRVEYITDAGMIQANLIMELTGLDPTPPIAEDLDVFRPEGYTVSDTTKAAPKPTAPDRAKPFNKPTNPTTQTPAPPTNPAAPNYTFTDTNKNIISRSTQQGRITVLYFFGSWSIPSKDTTPLLTTLAASFADQQTTPVDTFAIAVRESDPQALSDSLSSTPYSLTINPPNTLAPLFKVRVFPTIIVIDADSRIVFDESLSKDTTPQALIDHAKAAITKALAAP